MSEFISNIGSFFSNFGAFFEKLFNLIKNFSSTAFEFLIVILYDIPQMIIVYILPGLPQVFSICLTLMLSIMILILLVKFIMIFKFW